MICAAVQATLNPVLSTQVIWNEFGLIGGGVRNLGAIVGILLRIVGNTKQDRSTGSTIALQLVVDDLALTAQQSVKESLGCTLIAGGLVILPAPVECSFFLLIRLFLSSRAAVIAENLFLRQTARSV
jgi:hypothetical protein